MTSAFETTSLWSPKVLYILWGTQTVYTILLVIISFSLWRISTILDLIIFGGFGLATIVTVSFSAAQYVRFRKNTLGPKYMLVLSCLATAFWIIFDFFALVAFAGDVLAFDEERDSGRDGGARYLGRRRLNPVTFIDAMMILPSIAQLVYASIVYGRFRKEKKLLKGIQLENMEPESHRRYLVDNEQFPAK